jgi:hypothetical protein
MAISNVTVDGEEIAYTEARSIQRRTTKDDLLALKANTEEKLANIDAALAEFP